MTWGWKMTKKILKVRRPKDGWRCSLGLKNDLKTWLRPIYDYEKDDLMAAQGWSITKKNI